MIDYAAILTIKYSGKKWNMDGLEYDGIEWLDDSKKPTKAELDKLWPTVQYEVAYAKVSSTRQQQYQNISDPIFFKWQRGEASEQDWKKAVDEINAANPYPTAP